MRIIIDIPAEFENHFAFDHFRDSLGRIAYDLNSYEGDDLLSGKYEIETIEMLANALQGAEAYEKEEQTCQKR